MLSYLLNADTTYRRFYARETVGNHFLSSTAMLRMPSEPVVRDLLRSTRALSIRFFFAAPFDVNVPYPTQ